MNPVTKNKNALFEKLVSQVKKPITDKPFTIQSGENLEVINKYESPEIDNPQNNIPPLSSSRPAKDLTRVSPANSDPLKLGGQSTEALSPLRPSRVSCPKQRQTRTPLARRRTNS